MHVQGPLFVATPRTIHWPKRRRWVQSAQGFALDVVESAIRPEAPIIPEQGTGNGISGEMTIQIFTTCCIHPDPILALDGCDAPFEDIEFQYDSLIYEVYIQDRAGNVSNTIQTEPLLIKCY